MTKSLFTELCHELEEEEARLREVIATLSEELQKGLKGSIAELSAYDQHTADLGAESFERGKDVALRDNSLRLLGDVTAALELMERGEYGVCQDCGRPLAEARLRALPWATRCVSCQEARMLIPTGQQRPVEESVVPFEFTERGTVGFDPEDSWQALARFGTANTPQDVPGAVDYDEVYINADEDVGIVEPIEALTGDGTADGEDSGPVDQR